MILGEELDCIGDLAVTHELENVRRIATLFVADPQFQARMPNHGVFARSVKCLVDQVCCAQALLDGQECQHHCKQVRQEVIDRCVAPSRIGWCLAARPLSPRC